MRSWTVGAISPTFLLGTTNQEKHKRTALRGASVEGGALVAIYTQIRLVDCRQIAARTVQTGDKDATNLYCANKRVEDVDLAAGIL